MIILENYRVEYCMYYNFKRDDGDKFEVMGSIY